MLGQYLDLESQAGQPPSPKDYLNMVILKTGTLVETCREVAGKPAGMINPQFVLSTSERWYICSRL